MTRRAWALAAILPTVAAGLLSRRVLHGLLAKVAGDALYTVLVFELVVAIAPSTRARRAGAIAFAVSVAIELFQLTPYPAWLSSRHVLLRLVFGTTFGWIDMAGYAIGAALATASDAWITRTRIL